MSHGRTDGLTKNNLRSDDISANATRAGGLKDLSRFEGETWVYHCMCSHGAVVYVGIANDVGRRLGQHRASKDWWPDVESVIADRYPTRRQALAVEGHCIKHGNRTHMHNRQGYGADPKPPHRWEIRRDWDVRPDGSFFVRNYYELRGRGLVLLNADSTAAEWAEVK